MIDGTTNLTRRTLLMVLYGTGVRRTELSLLKVADIDSKRIQSCTSCKASERDYVALEQVWVAAP